MNRYDKEVDNYFGIVMGDETLIFIKTGRGGSIHGFRDKYLDLACELHRKYGCTVVVSANPVGTTCVLEIELGFIRDKIINPAVIYYVGSSDGATIGAMQGASVSEIKKMVLFNGPLMINFDCFSKGLNAYKGEVTAVYGTYDPSYPYLKQLESENKHVKIRVEEGADHNFRDMEDKQLEIIEESFFGELR